MYFCLSVLLEIFCFSFLGYIECSKSLTSGDCTPNGLPLLFTMVSYIVLEKICRFWKRVPGGSPPLDSVCGTKRPFSLKLWLSIEGGQSIPSTGKLVHYILSFLSTKEKERSSCLKKNFCVNF